MHYAVGCTYMYVTHTHVNCVTACLVVSFKMTLHEEIMYILHVCNDDHPFLPPSLSSSPLFTPPPFPLHTFLQLLPLYPSLLPSLLPFLYISWI